MSLLLVLLLIGQTGTGFYGAVPNLTTLAIDKPVLSVTGQGTASISIKVSEYKIIIYADAHDREKDEAQKISEQMREDITKVTKKIGGKADDVVLTNSNTLEPIEGDPYYRVEQDIQIWLKSVKDINRVKETYLLIDGVQIGSVTPIIGKTADYEPAIAKARKDAIKNAKAEAEALALDMDVLLGEPVYVTENITYPTYTAYEMTDESKITVMVMIYYTMIYKK